MKGHKEVVEVLLEHKADFNASTLAGEKPIHFTQKSGK
ncbi:ankyrin repeat domain-containing protein [bacterium]|nr:ankyrin repeat domain-containing protein [bacterium]